VRVSHLVVGGWIAGNGVLAGLLLGFRPSVVSIAVYAAGIVALTIFGLSVLVATRTGHGIGTSVRVPVRSTSAVLAALGLTLAGLALPYGWWWLVIALYPLAAAAVLVRGERLPASARPWPLVADGAAPADPDPSRRTLVHRGESSGPAVPVPPEHPAHGAPRPRRRGGLGRVVAVLAVLRAVVGLARRRRRGRQ
jgi:hypothetical protein